MVVIVLVVVIVVIVAVRVAIRVVFCLVVDGLIKVKFSCCNL